LSDASEVSSILVDRRGYVWVGTWNAGLRIIEPRSGKMVARYHDTRTSSGLQSNFIRAFHEDRNGLIWIAVKFAGLQIYDARREMFQHIQGSPWYLSGLRDQNVYSMAAQGNKVWIGTLHSGAYLYDPDDQSFVSLPLQKSPERPGLGRRIENIYIENPNQIWFCTDAGISELNPETGSIRNYPYNFCRNIIAIDRQRYLIGTIKGLSILDREQGSILPITPSVIEGDTDFPNSDSRAFFRNQDGEIWVATYLNGLWKYNADENRIKKVELTTSIEGKPSILNVRTPRFFHEDLTGNLWIGTRLEGLLKVNPTTGDTEVFGIENLLPTQTVFSIVEDQFGCLWLSTNIGIIRFHPQRSQVEVFDVAYGTQGLVFEPRSATRTDDGTILMGGANGINAFQPDQIKSYSYPAPLIFSSIHINEHEIAKDTLNPSARSLKHHQNFISFNFSLLDYSFPGKNRYRYRLHGIDSDWINAGQRNTVRYTSLPPGSYQFEVLGINPNQPDSKPTNRAVFEFTLTPPYWQSAWFRWLLAISVTFVLITIYAYGIQRERMQNRKLERLVQKRTDELQTANATLQSQSREIEIQNHQLQDHKNHLETTVLERTRELELARDHAEQSDRLKSAFIANMSHEIRTPLNAIMGFSHLIALEAEGRKEYEDYVGRITENSQMLVHLLDDIIDFSIIESGSVTLHPSEFTLDDFYASTSQDFSQYVAIRGKPRVRYEGRYSVQKTKQIVLQTDRFRLKQILSNYLSNACKFTETGQITFGIELVAHQEVHFWIKDTGRGIRSEDQSAVYERFHKIVNNDQPFVAGTGLGLSICKSLAEHLGAELTLVSEPDIGSTFGIKLPVYRIEDTPSTDPTPLESSSPHPQGNWKGITILVAEDTDHNFELIEKFLSGTGAHIIHAHDGQEAVQLFISAKPQPDLLLLDIKMPRLSGIEALARIRKINPGIPAIAQTAHALHSEVKEIMSHGFDRCITKPIDRGRFMETIASMISTKLR
jgi:signal transduction histidine kinase/CheY-like chemotaxis protein